MSYPDRSHTPLMAQNTPRRPRDARIDALRGLALVMIFIDHVPGNPYENFTIRNWGFSDAAEAFFVMSGMAAGLAYSRGLMPEPRAQNGLWFGIAPVWKRARTLYLVHLLLTVCAIAIFATAAAVFQMPALLSKHNLGAVFSSPQEVLFAIPLLGHQIGYVNILPVYCVLLLFAPAAILLGLRRPMLLVAVSIALWFAAGWWRISFPNFPKGGGWFFNPFSWQLIFVIGLVIGLEMRRGERLVRRSWLLFGLASAFLLFVLAWKYVPGLGPYMNYQMWRLGDAGAPFHLVSHNKSYLALPRLLHILALVYVVSCLPAVIRLCQARVAAPFRLLGQHGLLVFAVGTVFALAFQAVMDGFDDAAVLGWTLPPIGLMILLALAWIAGRRRQRGVPLRSLGSASASVSVIS